ncbi:MAG: DNA internalization-related competence protein ComEC/Rec2 [Acidobacteriota bacterium]
MPLALTAVVLVAGVAGGVLLEARSNLATTIMMCGAWSGIVLAYRRRLPRLLMASLCVLVAAAGWAVGADAVLRALNPSILTVLNNLSNAEPETAGRTFGEPVVVEARLLEDATRREGGVVLRAQARRVWSAGAYESASGGLIVTVGGTLHDASFDQWTEGRLIQAPMLLSVPDSYLNKGLPDQRRSAARRGVALVGSIKSAALVEVVEHGPWWDEAASRVRASVRRAIERRVAPHDRLSAAVAVAILIGDRSGLTPELETRLQEAGTYHVIAISGGNVAILAGVVLGGLAWIGIRGPFAAAAAIGLLGIYTLVAVGGVSVARASSMAIVYLAARLIDQRTAAAQAIGLTAAVNVLISPLAVADVGFWLTYGATGVLLVGVSAAPAAMRSPVRRLALGVLVASCLVELVLAPVSALVFQRVTLAGLVLNIVALPAMTVVQLAAMAAVMGDLLGAAGAASLAGQLVHLARLALTESARLVDLAPWFTWKVPSPHPGLLAAYYGALVLIVASLRAEGAAWRRARGGVFVLATALFLWIITAPAVRVRALGSGRLHLTVLDVGQGDALLVRFPNGRRLVVDTGGAPGRGRFDLGERVIGPVLRSLGVAELDYLAVTHAHPDHVGGARSLIRDFTPLEVWWGVPVANHDPSLRAREEADRVRATWRFLSRGHHFDVGAVVVRVLHPPPPDWERQQVRNNDSLVLELRFGDVSMLLTGDIDREVEQDLVDTMTLGPTVVLKVAHHGSTTSSSLRFVSAVNPRVALIGVGRGNSYGHPVPAVLSRLRRAGAAIFRTDTDGQIDVETDGRLVWVRTFTHRDRRYQRAF